MKILDDKLSVNFCESSLIRFLDLSHTHLKDVNELKNLTNLHHLIMFDTNIRNFSFMCDLINLETFACDSKYISNIGFLKFSNGIKNLILPNTNLTNLNDIKNHNIEVLNIKNTRVDELITFDNLKMIDIRNTFIKDLTPLCGLKYLEEIWVNRDNFKSLDKLAKNTKLRIYF